MTTFRLKNTAGFVGGWSGTELVEMRMNEDSDGIEDPLQKLYAQLQSLTEIVGRLVDDINPARTNVLDIVSIYDLEETNEEYTHGKP